MAPGLQQVARLRALPWILMLRAGVLMGERWTSLSDAERGRMLRLLRESRGRPGNLSSKERAELSKLLGKLDLKSAGRELLPLLVMAQKGRGRRH